MLTEKDHLEAAKNRKQSEIMQLRNQLRAKEEELKTLDLAARIMVGNNIEELPQLQKKTYGAISQAVREYLKNSENFTTGAVVNYLVAAGLLVKNQKAYTTVFSLLKRETEKNPELLTRWVKQRRQEEATSGE